jgi:hypothetical protein
MKSHELAKLLLSIEDRPIGCSVDMSTCDEDSGNRVFGDLIELNDIHSPELTLLFESGKTNY